MTIRSLFSFPRTFPSASLISQKDAESALDCGDYANEAMEREISVLLVVLAAVKACPQNTQQGHSWDVDHCGGGSCGDPDLKGFSLGQDFWRVREARFSQ